MKPPTPSHKPTYDRIPVSFTTFEEMAETGHEVGDDGRGERALYASLVRRNLLSRLTPTQKRVIICLNEDGMTRKAAARRLMVSVQEIHQIVARIKERFPEEDERLSRVLARIYWLLWNPTNPGAIVREWHSHPVLKDYRKPDRKTLRRWYVWEFRQLNRKEAGA